MSVCIARTEDGFLNGMRVFKGVYGDGVLFCVIHDSSLSDASLGGCDVRGELFCEASSNTSSSGPLDKRAEPDCDTVSSGLSFSTSHSSPLFVGSSSRPRPITSPKSCDSIPDDMSM